MISVAMAVYNGETYIEAQLDSILSQLAPEDEVVISLDPSVDHSLQLLTEYCKRDGRIRLVTGPGAGLMKNFEHAIGLCRGEFIFLADQDDCWAPDKVCACMECFLDSQVLVVLHDASVWDETLEKMYIPSFFEYKGCKPGYWNNLLKNSYMGCCMAFRRELLAYVLPFPEGIPMHDQWIGLLGEQYGNCVFLKKPLLQYRRHEGNMTGLTHAGIGQMLLWRIQLLGALLRRSLGRLFTRRKGAL